MLRTRLCLIRRCRYVGIKKMKCFFCDKKFEEDEKYEIIGGKPACKNCYVNSYESAQGRVPSGTPKKVFYTMIILMILTKLIRILIKSFST